MKNPHATRWDELAQRRGYFAVLRHDGSPQVEACDVATPEFFRTGEADVASLLTAAASMTGHEPSLASALDFGCGAGRLTLPLARRATSVTACDIAPTMLEHTRANAGKAGLRNITCIETGELLALPEGTFTFIGSLLVFQYVPRAIGYDTIRTLVRLLAPGGMAVLQLRLAPPGEALRQLVRMTRSRSHHRSIATPPAASGDDGLRLYQYDERVILRDVLAAGARIAGRLAAHAGDPTDAVLVIQRHEVRGTRHE